MSNNPRTILFISIAALCVVLGFVAVHQHNEAKVVSDNLSPTPIVQQNGNMILVSPAANDSVTQDFRIIGKARVFENVVSIRVKNKITDDIYLQDTTMTNAKDAGVMGDFTYDVHLVNHPSLRPGDKLVLEIYQTSPKDGSDVDKISIPLHFVPVMSE